MKHSLSMAACIAVCGAYAVPLTDPVALTDVTYRQDRDTQKVHVSYTLSNQGEPAYVVMDVLTNGTSIGIHNIRTFAVGSDVSQFDGVPVAEGTGKTITWLANRDWDGHLSTNAVVRLYAYYTNFINDVYMVVDLSGGPDATSYPVTYTTDVPDFQTDISCASNKLWLRRVDAGTFTMGSPSTETGRQSGEVQHEVTLTKPFYFGVFPVTVAQYRLVTGETKPIGDNNIVGSDKMLTTAYGVSWIDVRGPTNDTARTWPNSTYVAPDSFMGLLRAKTGIDRFDLPTEAQWEYACRAGTTTAWNNGTDCVVEYEDTETSDPNLDMLGWYKMNSGNKLHRVGQKQPNNWGIYDCHGNIWEWCLDAQGGLSSASVTDPKGDPNATRNRVQRGGSYSSRAAACRSAMRSNNKPAAGGSFRCAFQTGY